VSAARHILLAIEASNPSLSKGDEGSVAVCGVEGEEFHPLALERLRAGSRHDDALMRAVDDACRAAKVTAREIGRVAVSDGPGGYTGLRIALTSAKMLGETLGAALIPVPTARVATFGFLEDEPDAAREPFVVTLASKRESAWCQAFRGVDALGGGALCDADGLRAMLASSGAKTVLADEHLPRAMREVLGSAGVRVTLPRLDALLCARASIGLASVGVDALAPIYPREPEAVRKWNQEGSRQ
jgi:tRNA threonylcarbamoyl adenosine modification protein YeaZ